MVDGASAPAASAAAALEGFNPQPGGVLGELFGLQAPLPEMDPDADCVTCYKCGSQVQREDCQAEGSGKKKVFKCRDCNKLACRITRIVNKGGTFAEDWAQMPPEAVKTFFKEHSELQGTALCEAMEAAIECSVSQESRVHQGETGKYFPLAVYKNQGYTDTQLKSLEKNAQKKWDGTLQDWTYKLDVASENTRRDCSCCNRRQ